MLALLLVIVVKIAAFEDGLCRNQTIFQTQGDAVLTVFVDASFGPYCNYSSQKGFQEMTTALYVIATLNRHDYIPGITLGLRLMDTCRDSRSIYKHCLMTAAESECINNSYQHYDLGILVPENYIQVLKPLQEFTELPLSFYFNENITKPLVNAAIYFTRTNFQEIDLLLTDSETLLNIFLRETRNEGLCVKNINDFGKLNAKNEGLIVVAAGEEMIRSWIEKGAISGQKTWLILPLDDSELDEIVPIGSYLIKSESLSFDLQDYLEASSEDTIIHSPYLLSIGRALVSIAELFADIQRSNCPAGICSLPTFDTKLLEKMSINQVFDAMKLSRESQVARYTVGQRIDPEVNDLEEIAIYEVDFETFKVIANFSKEFAPPLKICDDEKGDCSHCMNFGKFEIPITTLSANLDVGINEKKSFKDEYWIPVVLVFVVCGTISSLAVGIFILYRYFVDDVLDGNPNLTILLIFANIFVLFSVFFFCLKEDVFGYEHINSLKIFLSTLSSGFLFSIMLSRSFFLIFSTGGVFTSHINGYLESVMVFFTSAVQLGMSTMYFSISSRNSGEIVRSPVFISLLSYDIFLLLALIGISSFLRDIPRNYHEGKYFFFTSIGIAAIWLIWILTFILVNSNWRDIIVSFGLLSTAYSIIAGILIPRIHLMILHLKRDKNVPGYIDGADMGIENRRNSTRQSRRPFYDYVLPMEGFSRTTNDHHSRNSNFYGNSTPSNQRQQMDDRISTQVNRKVSGYNNYGFHSNMQESENHYVVPKVCVENVDMKLKRKSTIKRRPTEPDYAQPYSVSTRVDPYDDDCMETEIYVEGKRLSQNRRSPNENYPSRSPSPRLYHAEATIPEDDEDGAHEMTKITRF